MGENTENYIVAAHAGNIVGFDQGIRIGSGGIWLYLTYILNKKLRK